MISRLSELLVGARAAGARIAVAGAADKVVLRAVKDAVEDEIAEFALYGDREEVHRLLDEIDLREGFEIIHASGADQAVQSAVASVADGSSTLLMKGNVKTGQLMSVYLEERFGLKTGFTMNLVSVFEIPTIDRLLVVSDAGMVPAPTLEQKVHSIINSIKVSKVLDQEETRVAIIAAVETVSAKMIATTDAAVISKMADRKQVKGALIDGPLALDNAISIDAAKQKGIDSPVAGKANVLIMPDIEAGNVFYKAVVFLSGAEVASTIIGGRVPTILTSRADSEKARLYSIALNVLLAKEKAHEDTGD